MANPVLSSDHSGPARAGGATACVIDDDEAYRELMVMALQGHCGVLQVQAFGGGKPALAALGSLPAAAWPALVLLDLHMPGMDGLAVLREIAASGFAHRVVLVSHAGTAQDRAACEALGARFLQKPARFEELMAALQDLMTITTRSSHDHTHRPGGRP